MTSSPSPASAAGITPPLKILCLHGMHQCGEIFSQRIGALRKKLRKFAEFAFVDAPYEMALEEEQ
eukprot:1038396-Amorphochlora_amoeboformis.AAC.1